MMEPQLQEQIINCCHQNGIQNVNFYESRRKSTEIQVAEEQLEFLQMSDQDGIHISGIYQGFQGETYLEQYDQESILASVKGLIQTALGNQKRKKDTGNPAIQNSVKEETLDYQQINIQSVIDTFIQLQKTGKSKGDVSTQISGTGFRQVEEEILIGSDQGNVIQQRNVFCQGSISVVAEQNGVKQNSHVSAFAKNPGELQYPQMAEGAMKDAVALLNAKPISSGAYPVVLGSHLAAELLSSFLPIFYQESAEQGNSRFFQKEGETVGAECLTIWQQPQWHSAPISRRVDDCGVPTRSQLLIEAGILRWLPGSGSGVNTRNTGNGKRADYRDVIHTGLWNVIVEKGTRQTEQLIQEMDEGVYLTQTDGLFAGVNPKTGDFSAICQGFLIENGACVRGIKQITVGGNIYDVFSELEEVSWDTSCSDDENNYVEAPAMKVRSLTIGGL